jgi:hypothetical protein
MQRNRSPYGIDVLFCHAVAAQKIASDIGAVDFETLVCARVGRCQAHVVEHGAGIKKLSIEMLTAPYSGQGRPVIDSARMMKE